MPQINVWNSPEFIAAVEALDAEIANNESQIFWSESEALILTPDHIFSIYEDGGHVHTTRAERTVFDDWEPVKYHFELVVSEDQDLHIMQTAEDNSTLIGTAFHSIPFGTHGNKAFIWAWDENQAHAILRQYLKETHYAEPAFESAGIISNGVYTVTQGKGADAQ